MALPSSTPSVPCRVPARVQGEPLVPVLAGGAASLRVLSPGETAGAQGDGDT